MPKTIAHAEADAKTTMTTAHAGDEGMMTRTTDHEANVEMTMTMTTDRGTGASADPLTRKTTARVISDAGKPDWVRVSLWGLWSSRFWCLVVLAMVSMRL
jgi:hypothetical protein